MTERVRSLNHAAPRADGEYVLYWSQMNRRVESNQALNHAVQLANQQNLPVLYYEGLTCSYPYANDRFHTFLLEGVPETARRLARLGVGYVFYPRKTKSDANDILYRLAQRASVIVTDDYPTFVARTHNAIVPEKIDIPYLVIDASCVVPMNAFEKREYAAYTIRPKIKKILPPYLEAIAISRPKRKWTAEIPKFHVEVTPDTVGALVARCDIDHSVPVSTTYRGGRLAAETLLGHFLDKGLRRYANGRNEPSEHATSDMSPYLHFGHISSLEIAVAVREYANEQKLFADEFLEELIVRRELAFNFTRHCDNYDSLECLPDWTRATLAKHDGDPREWTYSRDQFERAETHDALWNATQKEMLLRGKIHGYYRMYWGKKIIEWSATHADALATMLHIHDKYALDGRDPNTYTNVLWCFGLHDRPWTERPIFGMVRYMGLDGMKRKTHVDAYLREIEFLERTGKDPFRVS
ncbi:MAG: deoxyribodipyrimidine photo-lyase [Bryobacteraceae bacterium]